MTILDLFCGLGGFSSAFRERGHRVIGVDIVPPADVIADCRALPFRQTFRPDVILAAPPCIEFSRESMPWCRTGAVPASDLMDAAFAAVARFRPRFWAIENVRGAKRYMPPPAKIVGARWLWGDFPDFDCPREEFKERLAPSPDRARLRSRVSSALSLALCVAIEAAMANEIGPLFPRVPRAARACR